MTERRGLAQSVVGLGTSALDFLRRIPHHNRQIEFGTEHIDEMLTNALLLYAINHPYPDKTALTILGIDLTPGDLVNEIRENTELGQSGLQALRKRARRKGVVWVVQMLNPGQDASKLVEQWRTE